MPTYSFTVPTPQAQRVANGFSDVFKYQATIPDPVNPGQTIPNPESIQALIKRKIVDYMLDIVEQSETATAGSTAIAAARAKVRAEIAIT